MRIESIKSKIVGTTLGSLVEKIRLFYQFSKFLKHPELSGVLSEKIGQKKLFKNLIKKDFNCIDVGVHIGSTLSLLRKLAPEGNLIGIEADGEKVEFLKKNFKDIEIFNIALSDRIGEVFLKRNKRNSGLNRITFNESKENYSLVEKIPTATLDSLIPSEQRIHFIKIDIEGAELSALKGARTLLENSKPILFFESTKSGHQNFGQSPVELYDFLVKEYSYKIYTTLDYLNRSSCLAREEFLEAHNYPFRAFNFIAII